MGKKNSKLKQETIDRLTRDTYCEYLTSGNWPRRVACMTSEAETVMLCSIPCMFNNVEKSEF
jgi:hypothetical protein